MGMLERSSTDEPGDANQSAKSAADDPVGEPPQTEPEKNPHAVALGRLGGQKGGLARAKKLSKKRRREIAKRAAQARWTTGRE
jgi:hypothetical protein